MLTEKIKKYEEIGYMYNGEYELFIEDSKFIFKNIYDNTIYSIEYELKNYDNKYTDEELKQLEICLNVAEEFGFYIGGQDED